MAPSPFGPSFGFSFFGDDEESEEEKRKREEEERRKSRWQFLPDAAKEAADRRRDLAEELGAMPADELDLDPEPSLAGDALRSVASGTASLGANVVDAGEAAASAQRRLGNWAFGRDQDAEVEDLAEKVRDPFELAAEGFAPKPAKFTEEPLRASVQAIAGAVPSLAGVVGAGAAGGPVGAGIAAAAPIFGGSYGEARDRDVDRNTALAKALGETAVAAPLEYLGGKVVGQALRGKSRALEGALTEGGEELLQEQASMLAEGLTGKDLDVDEWTNRTLGAAVGGIGAGGALGLAGKPFQDVELRGGDRRQADVPVEVDRRVTDRRVLADSLEVPADGRVYPPGWREAALQAGAVPPVAPVPDPLKAPDRDWSRPNEAKVEPPTTPVAEDFEPDEIPTVERFRDLSIRKTQRKASGREAGAVPGPKEVKEGVQKKIAEELEPWSDATPEARVDYIWASQPGTDFMYRGDIKPGVPGAEINDLGPGFDEEVSYLERQVKSSEELAEIGRRAPGKEIFPGVVLDEAAVADAEKRGAGFRQKLETIKANQSLNSKVLWLTPSPEVASSYAGYGDPGEKTAHRVTRFAVRGNFLDLSDAASVEQARGALESAGFTAEDYSKAIELLTRRAARDATKKPEFLFRDAVLPFTRQRLSELGYDGVKVAPDETVIFDRGKSVREIPFGFTGVEQAAADGKRLWFDNGEAGSVPGPRPDPPSTREQVTKQLGDGTPKDPLDQILGESSPDAVDQAAARSLPVETAVRAVDAAETRPAELLIGDLGDPPPPGGPPRGSLPGGTEGEGGGHTPSVYEPVGGQPHFLRDLMRSPEMRRWFNRGAMSKRSLAEQPWAFDVLEASTRRQSANLGKLKNSSARYRTRVESIARESLPDAAAVMRASNDWLTSQADTPGTALAAPGQAAEGGRAAAEARIAELTSPETARELVGYLGSMRRVQDEISVGLAAENMPDSLREVVDSHLGEYVNRFYLLHQNPLEVLGRPLQHSSTPRQLGRGRSTAEAKRLNNLWQQANDRALVAADALVDHHVADVLAQHPELSRREAYQWLFEREAAASRELDSTAADAAAAEVARRQAETQAAAAGLSGAESEAASGGGQVAPENAEAVARERGRIERLGALAERPGTPSEGEVARRKLAEAQARLEALAGQSPEVVAEAQQAVEAAQAELQRAQAMEADARIRQDQADAGVEQQARSVLRERYQSGLLTYMQRFTAIDSPASVGLNSQSMSSYLPRQIWQPRGEIQAEVRELWGEIEDPVLRTFHSVEASGRFLEAQRAYNRIARTGRERGLIFDRDIPVEDLPKIPRLDAQGQPVMDAQGQPILDSPAPKILSDTSFADTELAGAQIIDQAFHQALMDEINNSATWSGLLEWGLSKGWPSEMAAKTALGVVKATSFVKAGKVVGGTQPQIRNLTSTPAYTLLNASAGSPFGLGGGKVSGPGRVPLHVRQSLLAKRLTNTNLFTGEDAGPVRRTLGAAGRAAQSLTGGSSQRTQTGERGESLLDTREYRDHVAEIIGARQQTARELREQQPELTDEQIAEAVGETRPDVVVATEGEAYFEGLIASRAVERGISVAEAEAELIETSQPFAQHYNETVLLPLGATGVDAQGLGEIERFRRPEDRVALRGELRDEMLPGLTGRLEKVGRTRALLERTAERPIAGAPLRGIGRLARRAGQAFQWSDEQARVFTWLAETNSEVYKATGGLPAPATEAEARSQLRLLRGLQTQAGENAANLYQNYDRLAGVVRLVRDIPYIAPFPGFPAEVARNTFHVANTGIQEMRQGIELAGEISLARRTAMAIDLFGVTPEGPGERTFYVGVRRLRRAAVSLGVLIPAYTATLGAAAFGTAALLRMGKDEDEDWRSLEGALPWWQRIWSDVPSEDIKHVEALTPDFMQGLASIRVGKENSGKMWVMDRSYPNPAAFFDPIIKAAMAGDADAAEKGIAGVIKYFGGAAINPDMTAQAFSELYEGAEKSAEISEGLGLSWQPFVEPGYKALKSVAPAQVMAFFRMGQALTDSKSGRGGTYDPATELTAWGGPRLMELDVFEHLRYSVGTRNRAVSALATAENKQAAATGVDDLVQRANVQTARMALDKADRQLAKEVAALRALKLADDAKIFEVFTTGRPEEKGGGGAQLSKKNANRLLEGVPMLRRESDAPKTLKEMLAPPKVAKPPQTLEEFRQQQLKKQLGY